MNYKVYHCTLKENVIFCIAILCIFELAGILFYENLFAGALLSFSLPYWMKQYRRKKAADKRWELNRDFRVGMNSLTAALKAGYSFENAWTAAGMELKRLYPADRPICVEFALVEQRLHHNIPAERALWDFAERSGVHDIENFANIFAIAKRSGGNLVRVVVSTGEVIGSKIQVQEEIHTMLAGKRLEGRIMEGAPAGILLYLRAASPEFLQPLYHSLQGILFMTAALLVYLAGILVSEKILKNVGEEW